MSSVKSKHDLVQDLIRKGQGKDYGAAEKAKFGTISVSLPEAMIVKLRAIKRNNEDTRSGPKSVSALIQEALEEKGY